MQSFRFSLEENKKDNEEITVEYSTDITNNIPTVETTQHEGETAVSEDTKSQDVQIVVTPSKSAKEPKKRFGFLRKFSFAKSETCSTGRDDEKQQKSGGTQRKVSGASNRERKLSTDSKSSRKILYISFHVHFITPPPFNMDKKIPTFFHKIQIGVIRNIS